MRHSVASESATEAGLDANKDWPWRRAVDFSSLTRVSPNRRRIVDLTAHFAASR